MTTEEAIKFALHPKIVKHLKKHVAAHNLESTTKKG
jgi:hypothetical protein